MSNSQIITHDFDFIEPKDLKEALEALGRKNSKALAGGTDLVNRLKDGREKPDAVVYIGKLRQLCGIEDGDVLTLGAAVPMREIERYPAVMKSFPCLAEAVNSVGGLQIRNTATLAGNLGNASPGADTTPPLVALGAELILYSAGGGDPVERRVPVEQFFSGPGKTVLRPAELIGKIVIPKPGASSGSAFLKLARVKLDIAKINCAVYLERKGNTCERIRIAVGSVAPTVVRARRVEEALTGAEIDFETLKLACARIGDDISPIDDIRSTAGYRLEVAAVLVGDVFTEAWKRSGGELS